MFLRVLDLQKEITVVTHDSVLPKEDVDNSHVLLPGVVVLVLKEDRVMSIKCEEWGFDHLWLCDQKAVLVPLSHRTGQGGDVGRSWVGCIQVGLSHLCLLQSFKHKLWHVDNASWCHYLILRQRIVLLSQTSLNHIFGRGPLSSEQRGLRFRFRESHGLEPIQCDGMF